MKTMWSHIGAILLCVCVSLYSGALNAAAPMGSGLMEMVICADGGAKTITVDANGQPVSPSAACCDCLVCNAPTTVFPSAAFEFGVAPSQFSKLTVLALHQTPAPIIISRPQARGPPPASNVYGVRTAPRCGLATKDTTV
ncbi:hypothetical protein [Pseudorhodobacter wandonensis]|uniref:hypothetical protein n=1 Tax=Pseudorhodobacter wandonensis TaxID=1120568 RepID=UPI000A95030B|nr:hypothetical protein [Pseudorhodobacter wandonensis]